MTDGDDAYLRAVLKEAGHEERLFQERRPRPPYYDISEELRMVKWMGCVMLVAAAITYGILAWVFW